MAGNGMKMNSFVLILVCLYTVEAAPRFIPLANIDYGSGTQNSAQTHDPSDFESLETTTDSGTSDSSGFSPLNPSTFAAPDPTDSSTFESSTFVATDPTGSDTFEPSTFAAPDPTGSTAFDPSGFGGSTSGNPISDDPTSTSIFPNPVDPTSTSETSSSTYFDDSSSTTSDSTTVTEESTSSETRRLTTPAPERLEPPTPKIPSSGNQHYLTPSLLFVIVSYFFIMI